MSTSELSLVVAALAVIVGPVTAYKLGVRRFAHERTLADQEDARSILAEGARELWRMKQVMRDQLTDLEEPLTSGENWPGDFGERIGALEERRDAVEAALDVIRIRFAKEHPVVTAYGDAWKAVRGLISVYVIARRDQGSRENYREAWECSEEFDRCRDTYLAAAEKAVGVELGGD
jgi:hypothetical protein